MEDMEALGVWVAQYLEKLILTKNWNFGSLQWPLVYVEG